MKRTMPALATVAALLIGGSASAYDITADIDGDTFVSFGEITTLIPDFPEADYAAMDVNGDGLLDFDEFNGPTGQAILAGWEATVNFVRVVDFDVDGDGILSTDELAVALPGVPRDQLVPINTARTAANLTTALPVARVGE